jgi:hypothetical protein
VQGFDTYSGALKEAVSRVPTQFFTDSWSLTKGERTTAFITVFAALGMALTVDLQRNGFFDGINSQLKEFDSLKLYETFTEVE